MAIADIALKVPALAHTADNTEIPPHEFVQHIIVKWDHTTSPQLALAADNPDPQVFTRNTSH